MAYLNTKWIQDASLTADKISVSALGAGLSGGAGVAIFIPTNGVTDAMLVEGYLKLDGTSAMTGVLNANSNRVTNVATPTANNDAVNLLYLEQRLAGLDYQKDIDQVVVGTQAPGVDLPASASAQRYIVSDASTMAAEWGTIVGIEDNDIIEYSGSAWEVVYDVSAQGAGALVWDTDQAAFLRWNGVDWVGLGGVSSLNAGAGLYKPSSIEVAIGQNTTGGIAVNADDIALNVDGSTIVVTGASPGTVGVAAGGITSTQLDLTDTYDFTGDSSFVNLTVSGTFEASTGFTLNGTSVTGIQTTITDSDDDLPTSGAVVDYVAATAGGVAGGSDTQIQFNDSGSFGASADLTWDGSDLKTNGGFQVYADSNHPIITTSYTTFARFDMNTYSSSSSLTSSGFGLQRARGTAASPSAVLSGDRFGYFMFGGYTGTGFDASASLGAYAAENFTGSANGAYITFEMNPVGSSSRVESLRLYSDRLEMLESSFSGSVTSGFGAVYPKTDGKLYFKNDGGTEYDLTASGSATPAGSDTEIQFNNSGSFGASSNLTFDGDSIRINSATGQILFQGTGDPATPAIGFLSDSDTNTGIYRAANHSLGICTSGQQRARFSSTGISVPTGTSSTSTTTGAGTFTGGVGITENLNVGGNADIDGTLSFNSGQAVDTIETTLTDDDTHLPTSGAVVDAIATPLTTVSIDDTDSPYSASYGEFIIADATSGDITINLPTAVSNADKRLVIKRIDNVLANTVTIDPNAAETIDGSLTATMDSQYQSKGMISDGTNIWIY